jgi:hypothetical protein
MRYRDASCNPDTQSHGFVEEDHRARTGISDTHPSRNPEGNRSRVLGATEFLADDTRDHSSRLVWGVARSRGLSSPRDRLTTIC